MIFRLLYGKMKVVCMRYASDADTAEDLVQEGFIKVFEKVANFNMEGSFEGWVRRIMVNNAIDYIRKNKALHLSMEDEHVQRKADAMSGEAEEETPEYLNISPEQILQAMQQLSPAYRAVFNLYVMENMAHHEIAEALEISVGTSKSNLAKARQNLKKILEKELAKTHER
jgi:RNA polymerase sigma-70 factor, ECF subfamily